MIRSAGPGGFGLPQIRRKRTGARKRRHRACARGSAGTDGLQTAIVGLDFEHQRRQRADYEGHWNRRLRGRASTVPPGRDATRLKRGEGPARLFRDSVKSADAQPTLRVVGARATGEIRA